MYPHSQPVFLDSPGWGYIHGEAAAQLGVRLPTHPTSRKTNPMLWLAEHLVTHH